MTEIKKIEGGAKGWHIVESRWHYFIEGKSLCEQQTFTAEQANVPYLGPRHVAECKACIHTVNRKRL